MEILIKGANVVFKNEIKKKDLLIKNKIIYEIKDNIYPVKQTKTIAASGLFCMPGLFDLHVHLRDPGFIEKETIKTGAKAAAAGGITSLACMANTNPPIDSKEAIELLNEKIGKEKIHIYPIAAITKNLKGKELVDFSKLKAFKAKGFSDDGFCLKNTKLLKKALEITNSINLPLIVHCEDKNLNSEENASEALEIAKIATLCLCLNLKAHIAHVSSYESVLIIKDAKKRGAPITAESCPHYFMLTKNDAKFGDANFKMNPPLREEKDRSAIENALIDGTIDIVSTDHAPHEETKKKDFKTALNGVIGLETLLSCCLTHLYHTKKMTLTSLIKLLTINPAKIINSKNKGEILKGAAADIILVDIDKKWTVTKNSLHSKSKNSPFLGKTLKGKVIYTFCSGELIYKYLGD